MLLPWVLLHDHLDGRVSRREVGAQVEIINDCRLEDGEIISVGPVAQRVRERRIPLEMCPACNMATSKLTADEHPFEALYRAGFNVTLSTDNRLMSNTSMSKEYEFALKHVGLDEHDLVREARSSLAAGINMGMDWI